MNMPSRLTRNINSQRLLDSWTPELPDHRLKPPGIPSARLGRVAEQQQEQQQHQQIEDSSIRHNVAVKLNDCIEQAFYAGPALADLRPCPFSPLGFSPVFLLLFLRFSHTHTHIHTQAHGQLCMHVGCSCGQAHAITELARSLPYTTKAIHMHTLRGNWAFLGLGECSNGKSIRHYTLTLSILVFKI